MPAASQRCQPECIAGGSQDKTVIARRTRPAQGYTPFITFKLCAILADASATDARISNNASSAR